MNYYEILVASNKYHGKTALTYCSDITLKPGSLVIVPLRSIGVMGVVKKSANKPSFKVLGITKILPCSSLPLELLLLLKWMTAYYPAPLGLLLQSFLPSGLLQQPKNKPDATVSASKAQQPPPLTDEQCVIINKIGSKSGSYLLHGETGSGKSRVYIELANKQLQIGRSSIILTPEIGLTTQLVRSFESSFPGLVTVLHSGQTSAQRRNNWLKILAQKKPQIVIGPRSTLFAPLKNIGLIVVDEAHDPSYKQDQTPHYHSTRVAAVLAKIHKAQLVLGSATPLVADYYTFKQKNLPILRMSNQAIKHTKSFKHDVITLSERQNFTKSPWLSDKMIEGINQSMKDNLQSLVFLNRRGSARVVLCKECGWQSLCKRCDTPLTYHHDTHQLRCHACGHNQPTPSSCPDCSNPDVSYKSIGTKSLVTEVKRLFPSARVARFDTDTAKSERLENLYDDVRSGKYDVLIGTQVLSKGLDLPKLSLVGVVNADTSLMMPDFTAEEHTYQLLSQLIGRVGRGHQHSTVIIQTYRPNNIAIKSAINKDYQSFYDFEIKSRKRFNLPPFTHILTLKTSRATSSSAQQAITKLTKHLRGYNAQISEPSPAFKAKVNNKHIWQLVIKATNRAELLKIIDQLPANTYYDIDPINLL